MATIFRYELGGKRFELDLDQPMSMAEVLALTAAGVNVDDFAARLVSRQFGSAVVLCGLTYLAELRANPTVVLADFARDLLIGDFKVLPADEPAGAGDGGPQRPSATRQRPKPRKAAK